MKPLTIHAQAEAEVLMAVAYYEGQRKGLGRAFRQESRKPSSAFKARPRRGWLWTTRALGNIGSGAFLIRSTTSSLTNRSGLRRSPIRNAVRVIGQVAAPTTNRKRLLRVLRVARTFHSRTTVNVP